MDFKIQTPFFGVKNSLKIKVYKVRMLSWLISLWLRRSIYEFPVHFRSNFRWKNFSIFLLAHKNRLQISGGLLGGPFYLLLHFIAQNREKHLSDFKIQKTMQLLNKQIDDFVFSFGRKFFPEIFAWNKVWDEPMFGTGYEQTWKVKTGLWSLSCFKPI